MIWFYRLLYLPGLCLALPYYLLRMWRRGGYRKDFLHRLGKFHRLPAKKANQQRIWLQAVSVGEVFAVGPLIDALNDGNNVEIVLTTTTSTGYAEARKRYKDDVLAIGIFPLDFYFFSKTAWRRIAPDAIILTESELWPEHLHRAHATNIPAFLVNARISDRSFERYLKFISLARTLLSRFSGIYPASTLDQQRILKLGARPESVELFGSIKLDSPLPKPLSIAERSELIETFGFQTVENTRIILGSSTWPNEEDTLIRIIGKLAEKRDDVRLLLVPRHAERGKEIVALLEKQPLPWSQRSNGIASEKAAIIHLADTTGELSQLTQIADLAFIGKSLEPNDGGQSPIEATGMGIPVLFGPKMSNFKTIASTLLSIGAAHEVRDDKELEASIRQLIDNSPQRERMSQAGKAWHHANKGSSKRIAKEIRRIING